MSGARAMIGIVWLAMTYGTSARSARREWTNIVARPSPSRLPSTKPMNASRHVYSAAPMRYWSRVASAPRWNGCPIT